ncbi:MAG: hypothetical protein U0797_01190 [Gemmataceae bacterium]
MRPGSRSVCWVATGAMVKKTALDAAAAWPGSPVYSARASAARPEAAVAAARPRPTGQS